MAVISLIGGEQAELIERKLMEDPRLGTEAMERMRIVCGDSRTMQGQERSIVFLSMVATPETAKLQNNQEARQRFNVALSRARDRLYLVRSVSREDLKPGDLKRAVIEHFADPMPEGRPYGGQSVLDRCASGFEREVCRRLIDANYRVRSQVKAGPFSIDLVVEGADDRRLAIELDGDAWHGPEKWDQDMSRQAALERAGWTFWRVFGSQWVSDQEYWWNNLVERLRVMGIKPIGVEAIDDVFTEFRVFDVSVGSEVHPASDAAQGPAAGDGEASAGDVRQAEVSKPEWDRSVTDGQEPSNEGVQGEGKDPVSHEPYPSRFYDDSYQETLRSIVWGLVDGEGPITSKYLCKRVARLHGFQRTGAQIKETIQRALKGTRALSYGTGDDAVVWPKNVAITEWVAFRGLTLEGRTRNWADVPIPEKLGFARMIVAKSLSDPENAMREALGMARLRTNTRVEIKALLEKAKAQLAAERESVQRASNVSYLNQRTRQS